MVEVWCNILSKAEGRCFVQALSLKYYMMIFLALYMQLHSDPTSAWTFGVCTCLEARLTCDQRLAWSCCMKRWAIIGSVKTIANGCGIQLFGHNG